MSLNIYDFILNIAKKVSLDYVHPVGQIFISANDSFDPNNEWGGYGKR